MSNQPNERPLPQTVDSPKGPFGPGNTPYDAIGGERRVRALVDAFYEKMDTDDRYAAARAVYPDDLAGPRERLYEFLCGWLGGPQLYVQKYGHPRLRLRHAGFSIGERERNHWIACMAAAMDQLGVRGDLREFLDERFAHVADFMRNS